MTVSVVDYGLGNLGSVLNMFRRGGTDARVVRAPDEVAKAERLLLPGVGAFDKGMWMLRNAGLEAAVRNHAASGRPLLGICLGMQMLADSSDEGVLPGLGLIPGRSVRLATDASRRVPHMGWNFIEPARRDELLRDLPDESRFYFVHTYHVVTAEPGDVLATTEYGDRFTSMVRSGNVMGAQFHPEKSHAFGMRILRNFASL